MAASRVFHQVVIERNVLIRINLTDLTGLNSL